METLFPWKVLVVALFLAESGVRLYYRLRTRRLLTWSRGSQEGAVVLAFRLILTLMMFAVTFLYIFHPEPIAWSIVPLPDAVRIASVFTGFAAVGLMAWAHHALGQSFQMTLRVNQKHRLVTDGPYRYIRHPIYAAFLVFFLSILGVSGCWLIGLTGILVIGILMTVRLKREEAQLVACFGDRYRDYMETTGRFLPRSRRRGTDRTGGIQLK